MSAIKASEMLTKLEEATERHIQLAVEEFQNMADDELLASAPDGGWSIAQCLDHLNSYAVYYYPRIEKGLAASKDKGEEYKPSWLGNYFTKILDPDTGKRKMKAFKKHVPPPQLDARRVVAEFIEQEEKLLQLLKTAHGRNLNSITIPISLTRFISMNLGDTFRFLIAHNERHIRQCERIMI